MTFIEDWGMRSRLYCVQMLQVIKYFNFSLIFAVFSILPGCKILIKDQKLIAGISLKYISKTVSQQ